MKSCFSRLCVQLRATKTLTFPEKCINCVVFEWKTQLEYSIQPVSFFSIGAFTHAPSGFQKVDNLGNHKLILIDWCCKFKSSEESIDSTGYLVICLYFIWSCQSNAKDNVSAAKLLEREISSSLKF